MTQSKPSARRPSGAVSDHMVLTVSELDRAVFEELARIGAAKPSGAPGKYIVTDREAAKSSAIMPRVFDRFGAKGLRLLAVNKMECYIFAHHAGRQFRYMVMTPPEMDRVAIEILQGNGQLAFAGVEGNSAAVEVINAEAGRIQVVLPQVLHKICGDTWELAAISGPQLYIFVSEDTVSSGT